MRSAFSSDTIAGRSRSSVGTRFRATATHRGKSIPAALCAFLLIAPSLQATEATDAVFNQIVRQARAAAAAPYQPNELALPGILQNLNYDTWRDITFRAGRGLWRDDRSPFEVQFFHPGYLFKQPVAVNELKDDQVRPVPFASKYFRYPDFDRAKLGDEKRFGFAGLRILYPLNRPKRMDEVISFLGSSYFRALGAGQAYGISARGIAIDTSENLTEEFPAFKKFWLCRPGTGAREMQLFALLDGPSIAGAYRFTITPGADTIVEIHAHLFFRRPVEVLGLAPLTSMFWRGEKQPIATNDRRPEVHDSDGLLIVTAAGEEKWHPLEPGDKVRTQLFSETNPKSFGLLQRDRDPSHYRDREAKYERRPSVRVESLGEWGEGKVRLLQLPAANEYNDNVVAFWQPEKSPVAGDELEFKYRLRWFSQESNKGLGSPVGRNSRMNQGITIHGPREWSEAQRRAETYLYTLHGGFGSAERHLLTQALTTARAHPDAAAHPVTLVMESLFALLPAEAAAPPVAMTPPMQRVTMLPEKTEFPFHDGLRQLFRTQLLPFAGVR